jgi:hypothetical protein
VGRRGGVVVRAVVGVLRSVAMEEGGWRISVDAEVEVVVVLWQWV